MHGLRVGRHVTGVLAVALVAVTLSAAAASALPPDSRFTDEQIAAGRTLLSYVPSDFRSTCTIEPLDKVPEPEGIIADVSCRPKVKAIASIEYEQFAAQPDVDTEYARHQDTAEGTPPAGCAGDASYRVSGQPAGRVTCFKDSLGTYIDYTYTPLLVVGLISQFDDDKGAPDIQALNDFSDNAAGPVTTPGEIPSLLSDAEAAQAVKELRSHLPAAIARRCKANDVAPTPWESASLTCEKPTREVFSATYDAYRDNETYKSAFDPKALAASSPVKNSTCPANGTWSTGGKKQGAYACWIDEAKTTHLVWGVDRDRIVASAFAQSGDGFTSAQFLHWWDTKGAVTP